jgi:hypothetical protein
MPLHSLPFLKVLCAVGALTTFVGFAAAQSDDPPFVPGYLDVKGSPGTTIYSTGGGWPEFPVITTPSAGWVRKNLGNVKWGDITCLVTPGSGADPLKFLAASLAAAEFSSTSTTLGPPAQYNFTLAVADGSGLYSQRQHGGWFLSSFTIPELDVSSNEPAFFSMVLTGGSSSAESHVKLKPNNYQNPGIQKKWFPANFRLTIDGVDCSRVNKVEAITIKQILLDLNGDGKLVPSFDASPLQFDIPAADAGPLDADLLLGNLAPPRNGELDLFDDAGNLIHAFGLGGLKPMGSSPDYDKTKPATTSEGKKEFVGHVSLLK